MCIRVQIGFQAHSICLSGERGNTFLLAEIELSQELVDDFLEAPAGCVVIAEWKRNCGFVVIVIMQYSRWLIGFT